MGSFALDKTAPRFVLGLAALTALAAVGCGSGSGTVSGEVKYGGRPLPSGAVTFLCEGGQKPVKTSDIVDGKYSVAGLAVGPATITVRTNRPSGPSISLEGKVVPPTTPPAPYVPIPSRYGVPDQSGLTYEVKGGSQTHDIDLAQ